MIEAKIPHWEEANPGIPDMPVGHDSSVEGISTTPAGYKLQP